MSGDVESNPGPEGGGVVAIPMETEAASPKPSPERNGRYIENLYRTSLTVTKDRVCYELGTGVF